jgi:hypothetical protein
MIKFTISEQFKLLGQSVNYHGIKAGGPEFEPYVHSFHLPIILLVPTEESIFSMNSVFLVILSICSAKSVLFIGHTDPSTIYRECSVNISDLRDGQRHDFWLPLKNIKMGRLHLAITVLEDHQKDNQKVPFTFFLLFYYVLLKNNEVSVAL